MFHGRHAMWPDPKQPGQRTALMLAVAPATGRTTLPSPVGCPGFGRLQDPHLMTTVFEKHPALHDCSRFYFLDEAPPVVVITLSSVSSPEQACWRSRRSTTSSKCPAGDY
ncbi:hypothetical protein BS78_02G200600 [Paspalum vaginatum]|nr:hypothetical protein BS78_02G200600 [Paspalum vaginatum]